MSIHAALRLTRAETTLIDAFSERQSLLPGNAAVLVKRVNAIEQIKAGLPTKRVEAWN
jgi:Fe-S cluster assembly protein SufD